MELMSKEQIEKVIVDVPDFPEKGIIFKDIAPVFLDPHALKSLIELFSQTIDFEFDKIAAIESRGFLLGIPLAQQLNVGTVLVRKKGKLPRETIEMSYGLEYGTDVIEIHKEDIKKGERILIVDDVLATGGTAEACEKLCKEAGAEVVGFRFLMELDFLKGRERLQAEVQSIL